MSNPFAKYVVKAEAIVAPLPTRKFDTFIDVSINVSRNTSTGEIAKDSFRIKISRRKHVPGVKASQGMKPEIVALSQSFKFGVDAFADLARKCAIATLGTSVWENDRSSSDRGELVEFSSEALEGLRKELLDTKEGPGLLAWFQELRLDGALPEPSKDGFWIPLNKSGSSDVSKDVMF